MNDRNWTDVVLVFTVPHTQAGACGSALKMASKPGNLFSGEISCKMWWFIAGCCPVPAAFRVAQVQALLSVLTYTFQYTAYKL